MPEPSSSTSGAPPVDSRPVPDPTSLTSAALRREVGQLRELLETLLRGETRIATEKFASVETQLDLIERQRVEQKNDTKAAVDAALAAAKEAVKEQTTASERAIEKSETATIKSIDQLGEKFDTAVDGLRREIGDLKERVTGVEQQKVGHREASDNTGTYIGLAIAAVGVLAAVVALLSR